MHETTRAKALDALEGMRQIVRREMVAPGAYVDQDVSNPRLAKSKSICGGRKHCAIGSLWAGAGIRAKFEYGSLEMPGVDQDSRPDFLRHRPGLRLAYDSLNDAAQAFINQNRGVHPTHAFRAPIESLFEGSYGNGDLTKRDLLSIISAAKRRVKAA